MRNAALLPHRVDQYLVAFSLFHEGRDPKAIYLTARFRKLKISLREARRRQRPSKSWH